jgi:hypothetical protein
LLPANLLAVNAPIWMSAAAQVVLRHDLSVSKNVFAVLAGNDSDAYKSGAAETIEATVDTTGVSAVARSLTTQQITPVDTEARREFIPALDEIAKRVAADAVPFSTRSEAALGDFVNALETNDATVRLQRLRDAVQQAPEFGPAQMELIATEAQTEAPELPASIAAARQSRSRFEKPDQVRFDALVAQVTHAPLAQQTAAAAAAVAIAPNDVEVLAALGRGQFLQGNRAGEVAIRRAMLLAGKTPQLQIALLQGLVETRQFAAAQKMLAEQPQTAASQLERAACYLLAGDAAQADTTAAAAFQAARDDALAPLRQAEWLAAKGDLSGATAAASSLAQAPDERALGAAQAAIWDLSLGRRKQAQALAAASAHAAVSATVKQIATVAVLLAGSESGTQLRTRLDQVKANRQAGDQVLAFGLFLYGDFAQAADAWHAIYQASGEADLQSRVFLAACYTRLNRSGDADKLRVVPVLPNLTGADPFSAITFIEMRRLLNL